MKMKLSQLAATMALVVSTAGALAAPRYTITDLGTLGGDSSTAVAINNNGQVTGVSTTAYGDKHAFVTDRNGNMIDLGTFGGNESNGTAINDKGQVTGNAQTADGYGHAFVTDRNINMIDLGAHSIHAGNAINNSGQVTGSSSGHAFVTDIEGNMIDLGALDAESSVGTHINDSGQVAGLLELGLLNYHAFVTDKYGNMEDKGPFGVQFISVRGLNENGQVLVNGRTYGASGFHAFVTNWYGNMIDLGTLGGDDSYGFAINFSGQVTGWSRIATSIDAHAFKTDRNNNMIDLGTLGGRTSYGNDINDSGQVVGSSKTKDGELHPFVTDGNGNMFDLTKLIDGFSYTRESSGRIYISDTGYIVDNGITINGEEHAFLYTPIGEAPIFTVEPIISRITESSATVTWETDSPSSSVVNYGLTNSVYNNASSEVLTTKHSVVLTGLTGGKLYYVNALSVDENGNSSKVSSTITFNTLNAIDTTAPVFTVVPRDKTVEATGYYTSVRLGTVAARDNDSAIVTISNDAPRSGFVVGNTTVTWSATDRSGNTATVTQMITVKEKTAYAWYVQAWGECIGSCETGNGTRFRMVYCKSSAGAQVSDINCTESKPATNEPCTVTMCPVKPDNPRLAVLTNGLNISLSWNSISGASGYRLYYAPYPYDPRKDHINSIDLGGSKTYSVNLWHGAAYYVAIRAYNSSGESGYSNIEQFSLK